MELGRVTAVKVTAADEAKAVAREIFAAVRDPAVRALPAVQKFFIERAGLVKGQKTATNYLGWPTTSEIGAQY